MKISHLMELLKAAELSCLRIDDDAHRKSVCEAIEAGNDELRRRLKARRLYRQTRPAQTTTRKLIRDQLRLAYHGVRLRRNGQWHVQPEPGTSWQLVARDDNEAQEFLVMEPAGKKQACGCRFQHSQAAGVIDACLLGQEQGSDETWTGY